MFRSRSWVGLYTLVLGFIGLAVALQLGQRLTGAKTTSLNPLIGILELTSGRVKASLVSWILIALVLIGCIIFYVVFGEEPNEKSPERKNQLLGAQKLEKTATDKNLSIHASRPGLTIGRIIGSGKCAIQSWESVGLYFMGPRMGKTSGIVVRHAIEAPGAYVFTANKPDGVAEIIAARQHMGQIWIWDTEGLLPVPIPAGQEKKPLMVWDFIGAITSRSRAEAYAKILNDSSKLSGENDNISSDAFFEPLAQNVVVASLLAASSRGYSVVKMLEMAKESTLAQLFSIVQQDFPLLAADVKKVAEQPDKTKENILAGASRILSALSNDEIIPWLASDKVRKNQLFDPAKFVHTRDTLIILVKDGGSSAATLSSLLAEAVMNAALDAASPRLDPPLVCDFDEANNTVHIRTMPKRYTYFGSRGIIVNQYFQTYSDGARLYGEKGFRALLSAATVKVVGGGIDEERELAAIAKTLGTYEKKTVSSSTSRAGGFRTGSTSTSVSRRKEEIMSVAELSNLPQFRAVCRISGVGRGLVETVPWFKDSVLKEKIDPKEVERIANSLGYSLGLQADSTESPHQPKKEPLRLV
ncbi:type IV secretory system conjugative DNA transfer family protein [Rothia sp. P5764]|uniref:type IV secretory system conjugative DNA transfer family protein n=1 Tax=Rothia sp. P5764 TaxID=3402654 RepID=UPI003AC4A8F3